MRLQVVSSAELSQELLPVHLQELDVLFSEKERL